MISENDLEKLNEEFRNENIEHRRRPLEAIKRISDRENKSINMASEEVDFIYEWFKSRSKPGTHEIGYLHRGVYYFDSTFWCVGINIGYGMVALKPLDALVDMPTNIKNDLCNDRNKSKNYMLFWADCLDLAYGYDDICKNSSFDQFGRKLLDSGYGELSSATLLLLENIPNRRAILYCRTASEMFLKSFIALKEGLTDRQARSYGHNLETAFDKVSEIANATLPEDLKDTLNIFPDISSRYQGQDDINNNKLFLAFCAAQSLGAVIAREFTDRNIQAQINKDMNIRS